MKHKSFSIEVPLGESKSARPLLHKFDKELEAHRYETRRTRILSDNPQSLGEGSYMRSTVTSRTMVSERAYLTFETQELIQKEKGKFFHTAGITGNISVCEEKDLEEFKQIVKSAFGIEDFKLHKLNKEK